MSQDTLYIAGPMSGHPDLNHPAFNRAALLLRELGYATLNPASLPTGERGEILRRDLSILGEWADGVAVLPGWWKSDGAVGEVSAALACQMPIYRLYPNYDRDRFEVRDPLPALTSRDARMAVVHYQQRKAAQEATTEEVEALIATMPRPDWDCYFMGMALYTAIRCGDDEQTKVGSVIVDWPSKAILATGYNGHPRGCTPGLPKVREGSKKLNGEIQGLPDKYPFMMHAERNALLHCRAESEHAVVYVPFPPCEVCLGMLAAHPWVKVRRIVYLADRPMPNTFTLAEHLPHISLEPYAGEDPATYLRIAAHHHDLVTCHQDVYRNGRTTYA